MGANAVDKKSALGCFQVSARLLAAVKGLDTVRGHRVEGAGEVEGGRETRRKVVNSWGPLALLTSMQKKCRLPFLPWSRVLVSIAIAGTHIR